MSILYVIYLNDIWNKIWIRLYIELQFVHPLFVYELYANSMLPLYDLKSTIFISGIISHTA